MNNKNKKIVLPQVWTNKSLVLMILMLFLSVGLYAQGKKLVTGTIHDNSGAPLAGATVKEIGTKNATTTDFVGKFTIEVTTGNSIEVTFMGFTTKNVHIDAN